MLGCSDSVEYLVKKRFLLGKPARHEPFLFLSKEVIKEVIKVK